MYYLQTHPQRVPQWRATRRNGATPSGVVVLHTAENATDFRVHDLGAENVARFITTRTDYGSYHVLVDSDSTILLAPWSAETWHDTRTNNHSVGISAAVRSADWSRLGARGHLIVDRMARAAAQYARWLRTTRGITIPARTITQAQALARVPGFVAHGTLDPTRRSDPGRDFPWARFLATYTAELEVTPIAGGTAPAQNTTPAPVAPEPVRSWIEMATPKEVQDAVEKAIRAATPKPAPVWVFFTHGDAHYEANMVQGWHRRLPDADVAKRRRDVCRATKTPFTVWENPVQQPLAFGPARD